MIERDYCDIIQAKMDSVFAGNTGGAGSKEQRQAYIVSSKWLRDAEYTRYT